MGKLAKTQIFGWKLGWKVKLKVTSAQPEIFRGRTVFLEQKHFTYDIVKEGSSGDNFFLFFSFKIFLKLHFKWELNCSMHTNSAVFSNIEVLLRILKKGRENLSSSLFLVALQSYFLKRGWYSTNVFLLDNVQK